MVIEIYCNKHPNYGAVKAPRANCASCRLIWSLLQGKKYNNMVHEDKSETVVQEHECDSSCCAGCIDGSCYDGY